ncbi:DUF4054 domain-containing protein [Sandarakinorhabdus sp. DWP1-3-1]|uniref:DUF4054 domain-containing protein n=1 Tax=Sandarakinorhabdus sp. DWP1-3-1 TaxID=2804627 RepID=UPI003CEC1528
MAITAIAANGWTATYSGTPPSTVLNEPLALTSPGYDNTGAAANDVRNILIAGRVRTAGGSASYSATDVALSMEVVAGATAAGVTNNSTQLSPLPVAQWATTFRRLIDGSARSVEVVAGHLWAKHDGRQVACVIFSASDGTNTVYQTVTDMVVSGESTDALPVYVYRATFTSTQMGSLSEGLIRYDARVIPWVGDNTAATDILRSIANTADWSARGLNENWDFSPRYDLKDLTRFANVPRAYVNPTTGSNTTGRWSTTDATARSLPFSSIAGAVGRASLDIVAGSSAYAVAGDMSGCEIRCSAATHIPGVAAAGTKVCKGAAALVITRDPFETRANVIIDISTSTAMRLRLGGFSGVPGSAMRFQGVSITRGVSASIQIETSGMNYVLFEDVAFNNNSQPAVVISSSGVNGYIDYHATTFTNLTASITTGGQSVRGCSWGLSGCNVTARALLGNRITDLQRINRPDYSVMMGNFVTALTTSSATIIVVSGVGRDVLDAANVLEMASGLSASQFWNYSGDANTQSTSNILHIHNTTVGYSDNGRYNWRYVDNNSPTTSRDRTHKQQLFKNNIGTQYNTKHDLFAGGGAGTLRTGGWPVAFGVGHDANFMMYMNASGSTSPASGGFNPDYEGPRSNIGASTSVLNNPLFVAPAHATAAGVGGAGGGNYALQAGSPALSMTEGPLLPGFYTAAGAIAPSGVSGFAFGSFNLLGTGAGSQAVGGASVATISIFGASAGLHPTFGIGSATINLFGAATGQQIGVGAGGNATAIISFDGGGTARHAIGGSGAATVQFFGSVTADFGGQPVFGVGQGSFDLFGTAAGTVGLPESAAVVAFRLSFPAFAAVLGATIDFWLTRAARSVDDSWTEGDREYGRQLLAAHLMTEQGLGIGAEAEMAAAGAGGFKSMKSGSLSLDRGDTGVAAGAYGGTAYGRQFALLLRQNRGGARVTGTGVVVGVYPFGRMPGW